jgi:hypothetical protein
VYLRHLVGLVRQHMGQGVSHGPGSGSEQNLRATTHVQRKLLDSCGSRLCNSAVQPEIRVVRALCCDCLAWCVP